MILSLTALAACFVMIFSMGCAKGSGGSGNHPDFEESQTQHDDVKNRE